MGYRAPGHATWSWPWRLLTFGLCAAAAALAVSMMVRAHGATCRAKQATIIWADQVTREEGDDVAPPQDLVRLADALASCNGGELLLIRAAGQGGVVAGPPVSLRVYREPGQPENDPLAREGGVARLISGAFLEARATPAPGSGRDLIGLLAAISADLRPGRDDVWLRTFGLPTVAPANARILMAADPALAAASISKWVPRLHGARVHLILSPPAGDQPWLNTVTDTWRRAFVVAVLREAGAAVVSVHEEQVVERSAPGVPPAPPVPNLPEMTPYPPRPPQAGRPYRIELDSSAFFMPNSTEFTASERQVLASLRPIIDGWRAGAFVRVTVVGHCARFGPPAGALALSRMRANIIAALLRQAGVRQVTAIGVGYSQPLPPSPYSAANRVVIVTGYPKS